MKYIFCCVATVCCDVISWPSWWAWSALLVCTFYFLMGETVCDFAAKFSDLHRINVFIYKLLWIPLIWKAGKKAIVQLLSRVWLFATPGTAARQASLSFTRLTRSLLKLMSIESAIPSNHLILCLPLLFLPSIFPSIRVFSKGSALHITWPNYWSFSISPSMNIPGWFPLGLTCLVSLQSKGLLRVFSNTAVQKHQFFGTQPSSWSNSHIHTWLWEKP